LPAKIPVNWNLRAGGNSLLAARKFPVLHFIFPVLILPIDLGDAVQQLESAAFFTETRRKI
jgi:hypothetical protein